MGKTKKVKTTGRFGARYGVGIRKRVVKIESEQRKKHLCPKCGFKRIKRKGTGIYYCTKCNTEFAGGAYLPETMTGGIIRKMVAQKSFMPNLGALMEAKELEEKGEFTPELIEEIQEEKKTEERELPEEKKKEEKREREKPREEKQKERFRKEKEERKPERKEKKEGKGIIGKAKSLFQLKKEKSDKK